MQPNPAPWAERFGLSTCPATAIDPAIAPAASGVAVIYTRDGANGRIWLVLESRRQSLRLLCEKRLQSGKLPPADQLTVSFKAEPLADATPEVVHAACREQVIFAGQLRRELRPAMR